MRLVRVTIPAAVALIAVTVEGCVGVTPVVAMSNQLPKIVSL